MSPYPSPSQQFIHRNDQSVDEPELESNPAPSNRQVLRCAFPTWSYPSIPLPPANILMMCIKSTGHNRLPCFTPYTSPCRGMTGRIVAHTIKKTIFCPLWSFVKTNGKQEVYREPMKQTDCIMEVVNLVYRVDDNRQQNLFRLFVVYSSPSDLAVINGKVPRQTRQEVITPHEL